MNERAHQSVSSTRRRELAELLLRKEGLAPSRIARRTTTGPAPLSFGQERLWLLNLLNSEANAAYNIAIAARFVGALDVDVLSACLNEIARRHESLRTCFEQVGGVASQTVVPAPSITLNVHDLGALARADRDTALHRAMTEEAARPFALTVAPLLRAQLLRVGVREHVLLMTMHHLVSDGWSIGVLLRELSVLYDARLHDRPSMLAELPIQYADYAAWQRDRLQGEVLERQLAYWRQHLAGAPAALDLPVDHPRSSMQDLRGATLAISLGRDLTAKLNELGRRESATLFMVLLVAFKVLLSRWSGQDDIVVGTPIANRAQAEIEALIGLFMNTVAVRTDLSGDPDFVTLLKRVKQGCLGAYAHQDLPFERVIEELRPVRDLSRQPIFQVLLALQSVPLEAVRLDGVELQPLGETVVSSKFDLSLYLHDRAGCLEGHIEYATALFAASTIERFAGHLKTLLEGIVAHPERRISEMPLLGEPERSQLLLNWNDAATERRQPQRFHEMFGEQAARTPDAIALGCRGEWLSYAELDLRSNRLAHHLRGLGAGPEVVVGLCVERSLDMVVALLGILKTGAAYLPLDPSYPPGRLANMLSDAGASALVTQAALAGMLSTYRGPCVVMDADREQIAARPSCAVEVEVQPDSLAYVIFTSGSTGRPKGVMVNRRAVANLLSAVVQALRLDASDVFLAVTPLSFDIAGLELFLPLTLGGRVVIAEKSAANDGAALQDQLLASEATVLQATPATWRLLIASGWRPGERLKLLCGGEALPNDVAAVIAQGKAGAWNLYGPTETTIWSTASQVRAGDRVAVGRPLANTQVYVLDKALQLAPIGVTGELHIGGAGLARGYVGKPGITAEGFLPSPFASGQRLYRTGDLARWRPDGELEYLGRTDHQVKLRGHRIEPGEIEAALIEHGAVAQAAVMACEDEDGDKRLVAFVVPKRECDAPVEVAMRFSLFYFAEGTADEADEDIYQLYLEGAKRADELGFEAVWTPERHFTELAAAYPNPSVLSAALSMVTRRVQLRAGSVVMPLHDPLRVAEEWAVVDNLSRGRVGLAFASGWLPDDFVFAPQCHADRTRVTAEGLQQVRQLWRGGSIVRKNGAGQEIQVKTLPRPKQKEPKFWLTTAGSPQSFETAGALGVNVLTALLNQSFSELAENITAYRASLAAHGHDPSRFVVTVMLHTFVAEEAETAVTLAREPLRRYLKSHGRLRQALLKDSDLPVDVGDDDLESLLDRILPRYLEQVSLIGSPASCVPIVKRLHDIGVGEVACLIDFGIGNAHVLASLASLRRLSDCANLQLDELSLRKHVAQKLPAYMTPSDIIVLDRLPLTANGKTDRLRLGTLVRRNAPRRSGGRPHTPTELALATMWEGLLRAQGIGVDDSFFELGGHSLLAARLVTQVRERFGVELSLRGLFETPTIAGTARAIDELRRHASPGKEHAPPIVPDPARRYEPFPLTDIQQAYWIGRNSALILGGVAAHSYFEFVSDSLDLPRLENALQRVIERHDMLRAIILPSGEQRVLERVPRYAIAVDDLGDLDEPGVARELKATRARMSHQVLDVSTWPLFEIRVSSLSSGKACIHVSFDILIGDAWSFQIFNRDLARFYRDEGEVIGALDCSFRDYVLAVRNSRETGKYVADRDYWIARCKDLPPAPTLPLAREPVARGKPQFERRSDWLEPASWQALQARAREAGVTPAVVLLTAFADAVAAFSGCLHFTLNLIVFDRQPLHPDVGEIIGDFTSMSLLEVDFSPPDPFARRARRLQQQLWRDLDHNAVSGVEVLREMSRASGAVTLMPVVFTSMLGVSEMAGALEPMPVGSRLTYNITQTPQVMLDCQISERDDGLAVNWDATTALFPEAFVATVFDSYCAALRSLAKETTSWKVVGGMPAPVDQLTRRAAVNATDMPLADALLHTPFLERAALDGDAPAIISQHRRLSYRDLERRSLQIAHRLQELGVQRNTLVAIVMEKGWEQVVAALGVLRASAAYLPIDSNWPDERIGHLIERGEASVVLTQSWLTGALTLPDTIRVICVDQEDPAPAGGDWTPPRQQLTDLAYVIYTSGSTGSPKGVMIEHRAALNTILDVNRRGGICALDRVFALSLLSFDLSVYDIFGTLAAGATIVIPEPSVHPDPRCWIATIADTGVTVWNSVPALLQLLLDEAERTGVRPSSLRLALLSGDWIPLSLPARLQRLSSDIALLAMGGATEASIWSNYRWVHEVDPVWTSIPYGRPLANQRLHVLNAALEPCPDWVEGQIFIGGIGVARGYWRDQERTDASFITHPQSGERLYRTGDMGRYLPDGEVEFLGRRDLQVKVQGHRIELSEIEGALVRYPGVSDAAVIAKGEQRGDKRLIAYVASQAALDTDEIRSFLRKKLPSYMVPMLIVALDALPLSANGKIHRQALSELGQEHRAQDYAETEPRSELERAIAEIWTDVLGTEWVGIQDNFFQLGGNSLQATRVCAQLLAKLGIDLPVAELFEKPTIEAIARAAEGRTAREEANVTIKAQQHTADMSAGGANGFALVTDAREREVFKLRRLGIRRFENGTSIRLGEHGKLDELPTMMRRRSARQFSRAPLKNDALGELLSCLRSRPLGNGYKYRYASAGGLYPVQTYVAAHARAPENGGLPIPTGTYYYDPVEHTLRSLVANARIDIAAHTMINHPVFDEAAFSLFLISEQDAIRPMYGEEGLRFALLEAGMMAQLLDERAALCGLALCHVGGVDFELCRELLRLERSHTLLHSYLGGGLREDEWAGSSADPDEYEEDVIQIG